jgi:serine protease Do
MMFILRVCISMVLSGVLMLQAHAEPFPCERLFPVPVSETREAVTFWLKSSGFYNLQTDGTAENGRLQIKAQNNENFCSIHLYPHSALATRVEVVSQQDQGLCRPGDLWAFMDKYLLKSDERSKAGPRIIPALVESLRKAAVCIYAESGRAPFQFSGFAIDHRGLIVTTAHDLHLGQVVTIKLHDGRRTQGRVVKLDADRDLSLVQAKEFVETIVSLQKGRYLPAASDALFACGCSDSEEMGIQAGVLHGPPRRVAGQLLWQVRMKIEPGSSGSPVFDDTGRVVAVVKGRFRGAHQIGFLIPFQTLVEFMDEQE